MEKNNGKLMGNLSGYSINFFRSKETVSTYAWKQLVINLTVLLDRIHSKSLDDITRMNYLRYRG